MRLALGDSYRDEVASPYAAIDNLAAAGGGEFTSNQPGR